MAPRFILYLAVEGVLIPREIAASYSLAASYCDSDDSKHFARLVEILAHNEQVGVVLNSTLVAKLGFHSLIQLFPRQLRYRVVGATVPGNRAIGRFRFALPSGRGSWLTADVERRKPEELTILEQNPYCVPVPFRDRAVIVSRGLWAAERGDWRKLRDLLH
jgi:hypothetical protein